MKCQIKCTNAKEEREKDFASFGHTGDGFGKSYQADNRHKQGPSFYS